MAIYKKNNPNSFEKNRNLNKSGVSDVRRPITEKKLYYSKCEC